MGISQDSPSAYDQHTHIDTFCRYWQNEDLLRLLATHIGNTEGEAHLDIGFSGRLGLFSCLASMIHVVNPSATQLVFGTSLLPQLVSFYHRAVPHLDDRRRVSHTASEVFPWLCECQADARRKIVQDICGQVRVLMSTGKSPREFQVVSHAGLFGPRMSSLRNTQFHSIAAIDVLPHVETIVPFFGEIRRVLRPEGHAIMSYFPCSEVACNPEESCCVDVVFARLARRFGIRLEVIYDSQMQEVHPTALGDIVRARAPEQYERLKARYWLDLPSFRLQTPEQVEETAYTAGLGVLKHIDVPGGMYKAARKAVVLAPQ